MHPDHNSGLLNAFRLSVFLLDQHPNVAFFEIFNDFLLIFVCKVHTSISGWTESEVHAFGWSVYNSIGTFSELFLCISQVGYMQWLNVHKVWKPVEMLWEHHEPWCWSGWVGDGLVQLHRTKREAADACFVAQHTTTENVQWNGNIGKFGKCLLKVLNQKYPTEPGVSLPRIPLRPGLLWLSNRAIKCDGKMISLLFFFLERFFGILVICFLITFL